MLLSLAAPFSHDASSRGAEPAAAEHVQAHVRPTDFGGTLTGGMFPRLDGRNRAGGDLAFVVGDFPVEVRNGYLLRDDVTVVGLTATHVPENGSSGVRLTGLWAVEHVAAPDAAPDGSDLGLLGLLAEGEFPWGFLTVGVARTFAGGYRSEGVDGGAGSRAPSTGAGYPLRASSSRYVDRMWKKHDSGSLLAVGYSTEVGHRRDLLYASGYWTDGDFRRPARGVPSPLGPAGPPFSDLGTGGHRPDLGTGRLHSAGFAVGMQAFFADEAANWAVELGHRQRPDHHYAELANTGATALTTRAQYRFAEHFLLQLDAYYAINGPGATNRRQDAETGKDSSALRVELRVSF